MHTPRTYKPLTRHTVLEDDERRQPVARVQPHDEKPRAQRAWEAADVNATARKQTALGPDQRKRGVAIKSILERGDRGEAMAANTGRDMNLVPANPRNAKALTLRNGTCGNGRRTKGSRACVCVRVRARTRACTYACVSARVRECARA
eukprot:3643554-Pleurochrysis_carterae.AAC.5